MPKTTARKLTDTHKAFLVRRLAMYDSPRDAAQALKEEHGVDITPQGAEAYDPNKRAGRSLAQKWRELFDHARKAFLDDVETHIPGANKAVRVKELWHAAVALKSMRNYTAMAEMLERIAKELGNVHTNRREVTGKDGGPMQFSDMTDEQLDDRLAKMMTAIAQAEDGGSDERGA